MVSLVLFWLALAVFTWSVFFIGLLVFTATKTRSCGDCEDKSCQGDCNQGWC